MDYRRLGRNGLKVSPLCLGTMMFGGPTDEPTAGRIVARAREQGVNFIDTANGYTGGRSEEVVGRAIAGDRHWWVLATKIANKVGEGPNGGGLSRRAVFEATEASLRRLGTDVIDLLYLHKEDHDDAARGDGARAGRSGAAGKDPLVRRVQLPRRGGSPRSAGCATRPGIDRPIASQPLYNLLNRQAEVEHLPACGYFGLGVVAYSPLARGVLTGKYRPDVPPPAGTRAGRQDRRMLETEWRPESLRVAREIAEHARARGMTPGQFAMAWVLRNRLLTAAIGGPRTEEQWEEYASCLDVRLDGGGRGAGGPPGGTRPCVEPGLQRPRLSDRGPADAGVTGNYSPDETTRRRRTSRNCQTSRTGTPIARSLARRSRDIPSAMSGGTPNNMPSPA